jgi:two-component system, cell cycle sensor histidine kinase and response regulator CckA
MEGHGTITIEALNAVVSKDKGKRINDGVVITVNDTGNGIAPEVLPRIFEPFFTTKPKGQGTGLGLAMVYNIVKDHEATIDVASVSGRGTTFTIYFPDPKDVARDYLQSIASPGASAIIKGSGHVLFADDEESLRNMGSVFLQRMGYEPLIAKDGEEAVKIFRESHRSIAAVVLDMTMPRLSGLETMRQIHQIDPKAKVILASGFTNEGTAEELVRAGAAAFLPKPYLIGPLAESLRKAIGKA